MMLLAVRSQKTQTAMNKNKSLAGIICSGIKVITFLILLIYLKWLLMLLVTRNHFFR